MREAVALACRVRLRPVLMTSLATLIGLMPMALKLGTGSEAYAPLARAIIGGLGRLRGADRLHRAGGLFAGLSPTPGHSAERLSCSGNKLTNYAMLKKSLRLLIVIVPHGPRHAAARGRAIHAYAA